MATIKMIIIIILHFNAAMSLRRLTEADRNLIMIMIMKSGSNPVTLWIYNDGNYYNDDGDDDGNDDDDDGALRCSFEKGRGG